MTNNKIHTVLERVYHDELPDVSDLEYLFNLSNHDDISATLLSGEYNFELCRDWHEAGADGNFLKIETFDESLYRSLLLHMESEVPEMSYENRFNCSRNPNMLRYIKWLRLHCRFEKQDD